MYLVGILALLVLAVPLRRTWSKRSGDWLAPTNVLAVSYATFYVIPSLLVAHDPSIDLYDLLEYYPHAIALVAIGFVAFALGASYRDRWGVRKHLPPELLSTPKAVRILVCFLIAGWSVRAYEMFFAGGYFHSFKDAAVYESEWTSFLFTIEYNAEFAFIMALILLHAHSNPRKSCLIGRSALMLPLCRMAIVLEVLYEFLRGGRYGPAIIIFYTLAVWTSWKRQLPYWRSLLGGAVMVFVILAVIPNYKLRIMEAGSTRFDPLAVVTAFWDALVATYTGESYIQGEYKPLGEYFYLQNTSRFDDTKTIAAIIAYTPEKFDYLYGKSLVSVLYFWIPRPLWPERPRLGDVDGQNVRSILTRIYFGSDTNSSTSVTRVGELYWNWHIPGVLVGMFIYGFVLQSLWHFCAWARPEFPSGMLIYIAVIPMVLYDGGGNLAEVIVNVFRWVLFLSICRSYIRIRA